MRTFILLTEALDAARCGGTAARLRDGRIVVAAGKVLDVLERAGSIAATYSLHRGRVVSVPRD